MELWTEVRRRVLTGEIGKRAACRQYQLHWQTLEKILGHVEPPGYRTATTRKRPKMEPFLPRIAEILEADRRAPKKQRHTAKRVPFESYRHRLSSPLPSIATTCRPRATRAFVCVRRPI